MDEQNQNRTDSWEKVCKTMKGGKSGSEKYLLRQWKVVKVGLKNNITSYNQIRNNKYSITCGK